MTPETLVSTLFPVGAIAAAALAVTLQPTLPRPDVTPVDHFQEADFSIYDRDFRLKDRTCRVGIREHGICLNRSPLEEAIVPGMVLPVRYPATSAEFPIILKAPLKASNLQTVRFGHRIALIDPATREVVDVLNLDAPTFAAAQDLTRQKADLATGTTRAS